VSTGTYGAARPDATRGGVISGVEPGGPAQRAGIRAGETLLDVDGEVLRDVVDWRWLTADGPFEVRVRAADGRERHVRVEPAWDGQPGVGFVAPLFDGVRECENACEFCFVSQLPPGMRPSLYVRDDDYRLSFLSGNFITLTNLSEEDTERIVEQRLSPLHWSLHATEADVRRGLVCATGEDRALEHADALLTAGIELHVQIVLVPGVNDGEVLERTLAWLAERPGIASVGVVPLGYTRHQSRYAASYGEADAAGAVIDALDPWRARMGAERGVRWVHAADELYLSVGRDLPPAAAYDDFPQYENGIGLVRTFLDGWDAAVDALPPSVGPLGGEVTLVTGEMFAPVLGECVESAATKGLRARVLAVPNRLMGGNVAVAGLLAAADIAEAIRSDAGKGPYLVPDVVLNTDGVTLDDVAERDLPALCGGDVRVVSSDAAELVAAIQSCAGGTGG
jgi:putative radical SAM enzyme (TIGR03279 family)